jgi:hypothetical protein
VVKNEPKTRLVTFRLSERDYAALKLACSIDQSSVSTVARRTVLAWAGFPAGRPSPLDQRLAEIADSLDTVCKLLRQNRAR